LEWDEKYEDSCFFGGGIPTALEHFCALDMAQLLVSPEESMFTRKFIFILFWGLN